MDPAQIQQIAHDVRDALVSLLPYAMAVGGKTLEGAEQQMGADTWNWLKSLWVKIRPSLEARPAGMEIARSVAVTPTDEESKAALAWQLREILLSDPTLAADLARSLARRPPEVSSVQATGRRSISIGRDVNQSIVNTGDLEK
jgi:hypothetical protein